MAATAASVGVVVGQPVEAEVQLRASAAAALASALRQRGLTQRQLAARLGVSEARVSQLLSASGNLTVRTLARVAGALGCKVQVCLVDDM